MTTATITSDYQVNYDLGYRAEPRQGDSPEAVEGHRAGLRDRVVGLAAEGRLEFASARERREAVEAALASPEGRTARLGNSHGRGDGLRGVKPSADAVADQGEYGAAYKRSYLAATSRPNPARFWKAVS